MTSTSPHLPLPEDVRRQLAGAFIDGWTDETIDDALEQLTGQDLWCLWDLCDDLGYGGDSELVVEDATTGRLLEAPSWIMDLLMGRDLGHTPDLPGSQVCASDEIAVRGPGRNLARQALTTP